MSQPILIAYDGSGAARAAVRAAGELFADRTALVMTVWEPGLAEFMLVPASTGIGTMMLPYDPVIAEKIDRAAEDHAREIAEDGVKLAVAHGMKAQALVVRDAKNVADELALAASEAAAAAIIIGSRGLKGLKSKLLGSTSAHLVGSSLLPVLVVHEHATPEP